MKLTSKSNTKLPEDGVSYFGSPGMYNEIVKDNTRYQLLDSMLYQKIARQSKFCNKLYQCTPIVHLGYCQAQPQLQLSQTQLGTEFSLNLASSSTQHPPSHHPPPRQVVEMGNTKNSPSSS